MMNKGYEKRAAFRMDMSSQTVVSKLGEASTWGVRPAIRWVKRCHGNNGTGVFIVVHHS